MKLKKTMCKILSLLSLIFFYVLSVLGLLITGAESVTVVKPESTFAKSWGFEPIYIDMNIHFDHSPDLYNDQAFRVLDVLSVGTTFLFVVLILWYVHKLFRNIYKDNVFMYENVSVIFRLGLVFLVVGTLYAFTNGLLESKAVQQLRITNAEVEIFNMSYVDFLLTGVVLVIASTSMKKAVHAVEENKDTI